MENERRRTNSRQAGTLLFAASFALYALVSPGNLPGDTEVRWSVARQILRGNGFEIEEDLSTNNYVLGVDGRRYSYYGLGQSICMLGFAAVGRVLEVSTLVGGATADMAAQFLASVMLFPAIGALTVWLLYRLVLSLGYRQRAAVLTAAVFAVCTMHFHYVASTHEQTQISLLAVAAMLLMSEYSKERRLIHLWLFCAALGLCLLFRSASIVMVLPIYLVAAISDLARCGRRRAVRVTARWLAAGALATGGFVVVCGWYNYVRFGSVFESGYSLVAETALGGHTMFESSPLPTLAAMLFSPGKSILLYNPVLVLLLFCAVPFYRRHKSLALAAAAAVAANFAFYSFCTTWAGDYAWSVRYQVPVLGLLVMPMAVLFAGRVRASIKVPVILLICACCVIQLASVVYNFNLEFVQNPNHSLIPDSWVWDWPQSHLLKRFENIGRHVAGRRDFGSVPVADEEPKLLKYNHGEQVVRNAYSVNFFPFKARHMLRSPKVFYPLLCFWLVLAAAFCTASFKLAHLCLQSGSQCERDSRGGRL